MRIGPLIAFRGATMFESAIGPAWMTILRPRFIRKGNLSRLIRFGWEREWFDIRDANRRIEKKLAPK